MMIPEELYHFDLKGYLLVKRAFDPDLICLLNEQLIKLEGADKYQLPPCCIPSWTPVVNEYRITNIIECGEPFVRLIDHPQVLQRVEGLVPPPIRLTEAYSISRRRGIGIPLHSIAIADYRVTGSGPRCNHLTAVVNLTDCGPEDGPFVVFEGSHKLGVPFPYSILHPNWPAPTHDVAFAAAYVKSMGGQSRGVPWEQIPGYKEVCVEAGDLVLFTENLWHGAKELYSDRTRRTLYFAYSPYHFANWHGIEYSEDLKRQVTDRQRELLAGPFIGYRYEGADTASRLPPGLPFQSMPNSECAAMSWNSRSASPQASIKRGDVAETAKDGVERQLKQRVKAHPELAHAGLGICQFTISGEGGGTWVIDWTDEGGTVRRGGSDGADCVVEASAEDFASLFHGATDPAELFYQGKLAIRGNVSMAMQLATLWEG